MLGVNYKSKKEIKENIGKLLHYIETSMFGAEFKSTGENTVVGPDAYNNRKYFATVTTENGIIRKVR
jgi:hypothetical protein